MPRDIVPSPSPFASPLAGRLGDTLWRERRLLDRATSLLTRQRQAMEVGASDDVDECTYTIQRVLLTLGEARKRRRALTSLLGYDPDTPVPQLAQLFASAMVSVADDDGGIGTSVQALLAVVRANRDAIRAALAACPEVGC